MPVIQLPRDDRWGSLGAGLSNLLGAVVQQAQTRAVARGVGEIWSDPGTPTDQKLLRSLQQYGDQGGQMGLELLKAQMMQEQLKGIGAKTQLEGSQGRLADARAALLAAQAPLTGPLQASKLSLQQAETARALAGATKEQAETEFTTGPRTQAERDLAGERIAATQKTLEELPKLQAETRLKQLELEQTQKIQGDQANLLAPKPGMAHPMDATLNTLPGLTDAHKEAARNIYNGIIGSAVSPKDLLGAREKAFTTAESYARRQSEQSATPAEAQKQASDAARSAVSASRFLDSFERSPRTGLFSGATIKAWFEGKGGSSGDAELLNQYDAGLQQAADTARQGGGFWSVGRFNLAKETTATIADSPLRAIINMDQISERRIAELQSYKAANPNRPLKDVDDALAAWQSVHERTSAYQTYVPGKGDTVLLHNGSALNVGNFKTIIDANKTYKDRDGTMWRGDTLTEIARSGTKNDPTPRTPEEVLRLLGISTRQ